MKTANDLKVEILNLIRVDNTCELKVDEFEIKGNKIIFVAAFKDGEFKDSLAYSSVNDKTSILNKISYEMNIKKLNSL
jgi:hypothetical protein